MKTLYLDCSMGAAGDMLTAALLELLPDPDAFIQEMNALHIPDVTITKEPAVKCGITGTHVTVTVGGETEREPQETEPDRDTAEHEHHHRHKHSHTHVHRSMREITGLISDLHLPESVETDVLAVYGLIAEAESHAHNMPVNEIHFHEVGAMDAIADITAVCLLMRRLSPDEVIVSPVHTGSGQVRCAHGVLPVPAPATAYILKDVPVYGGEIKGELCTPTGAALLKYFAAAFGAMPVMKIQKIGYGMGTKDFETANCVRAMLGETENKANVVLELSCNVDDMTAEAISFATERLFEGGALEVYTIPIGMKKSRLGTLIRVICTEQTRQSMLALLFLHTTTIGIRETTLRRYTLNRRIETISTPYGDVRKKISEGYGVTRSKYEYEDLARIAKEKNLSLTDVRKILGEN